MAEAKGENAADEAAKQRRKANPFIPEEKYEDIDEFFEVFDRDKDQMITKEEFTRMLQWLDFNPTNDDVDRLVAPIEETGTPGFYKGPQVDEMINKMYQTPDTIEELIESLKIFDTEQAGALPVPELRWALTQLGDQMDEMVVDELIKEVEPYSDKPGQIPIYEFAALCFAVKLEKKGGEDTKKKKK